MSTNNIPSHAISINFWYGKNLTGKFHVWEKGEGKWYWDAFGNNGEAKSYDAAIAAAREYIMNDYKGDTE